MLPRLLARTGRRLPTFALAGLVLVLALASSATAARLITGKDIKDDTVTTADVKDKTLKLKDLSDGARAGLQASFVGSHCVVPGSGGGTGPGTVEMNVAGNGDITLTCFVEVLGVDNDGDGFTPNGGDCDDADASTYPGAPELPDGIDNDCNGQFDEGLDTDGDGYVRPTDCNDADPAVNPGATEVMGDGIDQDCDYIVDDGTSTADVDADGYSVVLGDCNDATPAVNPGATDMPGDGIDQDCDAIDG